MHKKWTDILPPKKNAQLWEEKYNLPYNTIKRTMKMMLPLEDHHIFESCIACGQQLPVQPRINSSKNTPHQNTLLIT